MENLLKTLLLLSLSPLLHAADITWATATNTTGKTNLIEGETLHAWSGGTAATITNGGASGTSTYVFNAVTYSDFTFNPAATGLSFADSSAGAASTGDANMDSLLKTLTYTSNGITTGTQTISGLTVGEAYQIQIFFNDQRNTRSMTFGDGNTNVNVSGQGSGWGQYTIGTFTADATTQNITHATNGFGNIHVNAMLITDAATTPSVTLTTISQSVSAPYTIDITFSEPITGLEESDFTITNGTIQASSLTGSGANWTVSIVPNANGDVSITLPAASATDTDGDNNTNTASNTLVTTYIAPGSDQPIPTLSTANSVVLSAYTVSINFTESVTGLELSDFLTTNATLSNLTGTGANYTILVTPSNIGEISINLPKNSATDQDGDNLMNPTSNLLISNYTTPLTVAIFGATATDSQEFDINLTFSDAINGLETTDFQITNGTVTSITALARREFANRYFTVTIRANTPGQVQALLPASSVSSIAFPSLQNQPSNQFTTQNTFEFTIKWTIDDQATWTASTKNSNNITLANGFAEPSADNSQFSSTTKTFPVKRKARTVTFDQSPVWDNWTGVANVGGGGSDAAILLPIANDDYYYLARGSTGGYHAWHSTDMVNWTAHGPITSPTHRWVTTAEYKDGTFYIYVDHPNDHTPALYTDTNLKDGILGTYHGVVFPDPTHGSDCSVIRDNADGRFHIIHEDWTPINARAHAWDSPLAGHVSSPDGGLTTPFTPAGHAPAVDVRTTDTGQIGTYASASSHRSTGEYGDTLEYQIHTDGQDAFGDWTSVKIGSRFYLFGDFDPHGQAIRSARFTSDSIYGQFQQVGELGSGHPDPSIGFAEGQFYLITQQSTDYTSPGPWVDGVEARAGVDTNADGNIDQWTTWQVINESYDHTPGYARVVTKTPAQIDLSTLPEGYGFEFEFRIDNTIVAAVSPIMDRVEMTFEPTNFEQWANAGTTNPVLTEDHNNNGISNIIEFATGLTNLTDLQPNENGLITLTISKAAIDDGYTLKLEYCLNMINWNTATTLTEHIELISEVAQPNGDIKYQFKIDDQLDPELFWRVKIE